MNIYVFLKYDLIHFHFKVSIDFSQFNHDDTSTFSPSFKLPFGFNDFIARFQSFFTMISPLLRSILISRL